MKSGDYVSFSFESLARGRLNLPRAATQELVSPISRTPEEIQRDILSAGQYESFGASVTPATALAVATVFACVRILADSISMLPLTLYKKDGDTLKADFDSPVGQLLAYAPTLIHTPYEFWRLVMVRLLLSGNFYAKKVIVKGQVQSLFPLDPDQITPRSVNDTTVVYDYKPPNSAAITYKADDIFHLRNINADGLVGSSTLKVAAKAIGVAILGESHAGHTFKNGARPSGAFETDAALSDEAYNRLRDNLTSTYSGANNSGKPMLLESGLKWAQMQMSAEDSQFMESRAFQRGEICIFFGIPPQLIGDVNKGTSWGTGVEQQNLAFLTHTLKPYLVNIQQRVIRSLIVSEDQAKYVAKFDTAELTKADFAARQTGYQVQRRNGVISANEWRKAEGLDPIKEPKADDYLIDQTLIEEPLDPNAGADGSGASVDDGDGSSPDAEASGGVSAFGTR